MFQGTYQKILLGITLLILVIVAFSLFTNAGTKEIFLLHGEFYYSGKQQLLSPVREVQQTNRMQQTAPSIGAKKNDLMLNTLPPAEIKQMDTMQQGSPPEETKKVDEMQQNLTHEEVKQDDKKQPMSPKEEAENKPTSSPTDKAKQDDKKQPTSPPTKKAKEDDKKQPTSPPTDKAKQDDKKQPTSPPTEKAKQDDKKQPTSPPTEKAKEGDKKQPTSSPTEKAKQDGKKQPTPPPPGAKQAAKQTQHPPAPVDTTKQSDSEFVKFSRGQPKYGTYIDHLPASQVERLVRLMGVTNLNTRKAQQEYLKCAGIQTLRSTKDSLLNPPIPIPSNNQNCKKMSFKSSGPVVALSSIPGSGNSWVRQLLESTTGIYTGAVYCDPSYVTAGMIGEGMTTNNVLVIKLHYAPTFVKNYLHNDKAIYIVRSPFAAILAENNRNVARVSKKYLALGDSHVMEVDFKYENNVAWKNQVKKQAREWRIQVMQWLNYKQVPVHIVGYSNLKKNTYTELKKMLDFLGYSYTEDDLLCTIKSSGETFHRNHTRKNLQPFSPELEKFVLNEIKQVDAGLLKHNISLYHPYSHDD